MATDDKYDRQLRLWGANGQRRLMESSILLIRADSVGTETLKNLVLPGIGSISILDDFLVDNRDLACNFFVSAEHIGKPRAEVVASLLCEMNEDVKGYARVANFKNVFLADRDYFDQFSLIVAANLPEGDLVDLSRYCLEKHTPLVAVRSYGLLGTIRLQLKGHWIVESKLETDQFDLRIANPFPALQAFCEQEQYIKLLEPTSTDVDSMHHAHIPYVVILYHAIKRWKLEHGGNVPSNFSEKEKFKSSIKSMAKDINNEVNFQEAIRESYRAYTIKSMPYELEEMLRVTTPNSTLGLQTSNFEFLVLALAKFTSTGNQDLPLGGRFPDMTATTEEFVQLQQLYQSKAQEDLFLFQRILCDLLQTSRQPVDRISDDEIQTFCKNAAGIKSITSNPIFLELSHCSNGAVKPGTLANNAVTVEEANIMDIDPHQSSTTSAILEYLEDDLYADPQQTPIIWYLALRAAECFFSRHGRWPGAESPDSNLEKDQNDVFSNLSALCSHLGFNGCESSASGNIDKESMLIGKAHAEEITRYGGGEYHSTSAVIGGVAAQEVVKIITHQYVPLDNTYVFNGIAACAATYSL